MAGSRSASRVSVGPVTNERFGSFACGSMHAGGCAETSEVLSCRSDQQNLERESDGRFMLQVVQRW